MSRPVITQYLSTNTQEITFTSALLLALCTAAKVLLVRISDHAGDSRTSTPAASELTSQVRLKHMIVAIFPSHLLECEYGTAQDCTNCALTSRCGRATLCRVLLQVASLRLSAKDLARSPLVGTDVRAGGSMPFTPIWPCPRTIWRAVAPSLILEDQTRGPSGSSVGGDDTEPPCIARTARVRESLEEAINLKPELEASMARAADLVRYSTMINALHIFRPSHGTRMVKLIRKMWRQFPHKKIMHAPLAVHKDVLVLWQTLGIGAYRQMLRGSGAVFLFSRIALVTHRVRGDVCKPWFISSFAVCFTLYELCACLARCLS